MYKQELKYILEQKFLNTKNDSQLTNNILKYLFVCDRCRTVDPKPTDSNIFEGDKICLHCGLDLQLVFALNTHPENRYGDIIHNFVMYNDDFTQSEPYYKKKIIEKITRIINCFTYDSDLKITSLNYIYTTAKKLVEIDEIQNKEMEKN